MSDHGDRVFDEFDSVEEYAEHRMSKMGVERPTVEDYQRFERLLAERDVTDRLEED